jgi:COP9 signalosome complex subunit 3
MKPIRSAIFRLDPSASLLTSTHLYLVKLALETRKYEEALPVLDKYIFQFPGAPHHPKPAFLCEQGLPPAAYITYESKLTSKLKYQDVLEYFLYSGMVYIGLRRWENALECLENAITYPTRDASKIMVEAYKKWVLVGLLLEGKLLSLPRYTGSGAAKIYHNLAKPYDCRRLTKCYVEPPSYWACNLNLFSWRTKIIRGPDRERAAGLEAAHPDFNRGDQEDGPNAHIRQ